MILDPITGSPVQKTLTPPASANTIGNAKPLFSDDFQEKALAINGTEEQRQQAVGGINAPVYDINNPKYKNVL